MLKLQAITWHTFLKNLPHLVFLSPRSVKKWKKAYLLRQNVKVHMWDPIKYIYSWSLSIFSSVCHVQTTFLGDHNSFWFQILIDMQSTCGQNKIERFFNSTSQSLPSGWLKSQSQFRNLNFCKIIHEVEHKQTASLDF